MITRRGNRHFRCPICGDLVTAGYQDVDMVHQCRENDRTRMKTRKEWNKIPGRVTLKIDDDSFPNLGLNPFPGLIPEKKIKEQKYEEIEVDTFIELD